LDKENARPTFKKGYGVHPLCAFVDHGAQGTGELLAIQLRPGNAGSNTANRLARHRDGYPARIAGRRQRDVQSSRELGRLIQSHLALTNSRRNAVWSSTLQASTSV
jgi:hypothetical protein